MGTEGAFLELLTNLLTQFFTPSKDVNSLSGRRDHGLEFVMSSTATANARPTLRQKQSNVNSNSIKISCGASSTWIYMYLIFVGQYLGEVKGKATLRPKWLTLPEL